MLLARQLCGLPVPEAHQQTASSFADAIKSVTCDAIVISSETLDSLLLDRNCGRRFFTRMEELHLEPRIVLFPRNQSQLLNSRYTQVIKGFERSDSFETFVRADIRHRSYRYSGFIALADAYRVKLIAAAFTENTLVRGVVIEFLKAIGTDSSQFQGTEVRRNPGAGPFTVGVARGVLRSLGNEVRGTDMVAGFTVSKDTCCLPGRKATGGQRVLWTDNCFGPASRRRMASRQR